MNPDAPFSTGRFFMREGEISARETACFQFQTRNLSRENAYQMAAATIEIFT